MNRIRIGIALVIVCAVPFAANVVVGQDNSAREKDRAEIEEGRDACARNSVVSKRFY